MEIVIPYDPRPHQRAAFSQLKRFNVLVWHRRAGKTVFAVNWLIRQALSCSLNNPRTAYLAPQYKQAKRIAWQYVKDYTAPIPGMGYLEQELRAVFPGGAELWLLGADNPDALRGLYLDAVVLDEVAMMAPRTWGEIVRPALADRGGGALMIGTPFGMANQFHEFYNRAADLEGWTRSLLTVLDTDAINPAELVSLEAEMRPEEWQQEMLCSFSAAVRGAFYAEAMQVAEREGRITRVPHDPLLQVHTSWDLGIANRTVVWLWQVSGAENRAIKCLAFSGMGLPEIIAQLRALPYNWGEHYAPHDAQVRELGSGKSRVEMAAALGMRWTVVPQVGLQSGIDSTRAMLGRCWFDKEGCKDGLEALRLYRTEYDEDHRVYSTKPLHDWTSDFADSVRMFAVSQQGKGGNWGTIDYSKLDRMVAI